MRNNRKWRIAVLAGTLAMLLILTACSGVGGKSNSDIGEMDREDEGTLKVAYFNEQAFYMQYGNAFQAMFPNVKMEVVSLEPVFNAADQVAEMEKLVSEQQPDVLYLTEEQYAALAEKGLLYDLDAAVKQDQLDLDSFHPSVIELLKTWGGGKLYGLSPDFSSQALYYNKDMFDQYGVPYPTDGMSWEEVLQLATRFPVQKNDDDVTYGLMQPSQTQDLFSLVRTIGEAKGLLYADADSGTVSIDSPEWKAIFQAVVDGYKTGSISMPSSGNDGGRVMAMAVRGAGGARTFSFGPDSMKFMTGQAAMTIDGSMLMEMLRMNAGGGGIRINANAPTGSNDKQGAAPPPIQNFEWDLATVPVDPSLPDVMGGISLGSIFAINAASENLSAAWELIQYINGEQLAKTNAMSAPALSARTAYKKAADGKNIDAFYKLGVNEQALLQSLPAGFADSFAQMASGLIQQVVDGSVSLDNALAQMQSQGQDLLTKADLASSTS